MSHIIIARPGPSIVLKECPLCNRLPEPEIYKDGQRYRCRGCGDCGEWEISRARAAESWNLGITDEYVKEVTEAI